MRLRADLWFAKAFFSCAWLQYDTRAPDNTPPGRRVDRHSQRSFRTPAGVEPSVQPIWPLADTEWTGSGV